VNVILIYGDKQVMKYQVRIGVDIGINEENQGKLYKECKKGGLSETLSLKTYVDHNFVEIDIMALNEGMLIESQKGLNSYYTFTNGTSRKEDDFDHKVLSSSANTTHRILETIPVTDSKPTSGDKGSKGKKEDNDNGYLMKLQQHQISLTQGDKTDFFLQPTFQGQFMNYNYTCLNPVTFEQETCVFTNSPNGDSMNQKYQIKDVHTNLPFISSSRKIINSFSLTYDQDLYFDSVGYVI
jgi:hypothetical protein